MRPDPLLLGAARDADGRLVPAPELRVTPEMALLLLPAVRAWLAEHERMGANTKVAAARPLVTRWEYLAAWAQDGCVSATGVGAADGGSRPSPHEITRREAADRLDCTPQWVSRLCGSGELDSRKVGGARMVTVASLEAHRRRRGR